ncbi:MAG: type II toxin-antitoxin system HicB family antitoxin [Deltaproteobacteria bacterium]|jgi:predicted RNase H-like HicB family nuclease|nr:type II toxin-antitoxin system HicB family antitoxin [Deltaproteobacteria bacterium]
MNYKVIIEPDTESGGYVAYCPTLRGCVSEGHTVDEALENMKKAMKGYLMVLEEELARKKDVNVYEVAM